MIMLLQNPSPGVYKGRENQVQYLLSICQRPKVSGHAFISKDRFS